MREEGLVISAQVAEGISKRARNDEEAGVAGEISHHTCRVVLVILLHRN